MEVVKEKVLKLLEELFDSAQTNGGVEYLYTLVRVDGISMGVLDPLIELQETLKNDLSNLSEQALRNEFCSLIEREPPLSLIANLLNSACGKPYNPSPFSKLYSGQLSDIRKPAVSDLLHELIKLANETNNSEIAQLISVCYPDDVIRSCTSKGLAVSTERIRVVTENCRLFLGLLLEIYFQKRLECKNKRELYKLPGFEVLEVLVDEEYGLYGFRMHFSNGGSAKFIRKRDSTECENVYLSAPINFMVGDLGQLRDEWRMDNKRLYEVGLPGRYNELGEWKPLIYPGDSEPLQKEAQAMSDDDDVQGSYFYMLCTCYHVIEFVVKTNIELPTETGSFGQKLHLWKCPLPSNGISTSDNVRIYDGWLEVENLSIEYIRSAIAAIGVAVNRMVFAYGGWAKWRLKYRMELKAEGMATPSGDDLKLLDSLLKQFPTTEDASVLDYALDWYNQARSERNVFTAFLCYYIALESVVIAVADGKGDLGLGYSRDSKEEQKRKRIECIQAKQKELYAKDPERFASEVYFDCVLSLKDKTRRVAELVFGHDHEYIGLLLNKKDGFSLSDIRGRLAHGGVSSLDRDDEKLVRGRIGEIATISKEFLMRIIFFLKPSNPLPSWSGQHRASMSVADPRYTLVSNTSKIFPTNDWRIRAEWCD